MRERKIVAFSALPGVMRWHLISTRESLHTACWLSAAGAESSVSKRELSSLGLACMPVAGEIVFGWVGSIGVCVVSPLWVSSGPGGQGCSTKTPGVAGAAAFHTDCESLTPHTA